MSDRPEGDRAVSPVAGTRGRFSSQTLGLGSIAAVVLAVQGYLWFGGGKTKTDPAAPQAETKIGQVVAYEAPRFPDEPQPRPQPPPTAPAVAPQPAPQAAPPQAGPQAQPPSFSFNKPEHRWFYAYAPGAATAPKAGHSDPGAAREGGGEDDRTHVAYKAATVPGARAGLIDSADLVLKPGLFGCTLDLGIDSSISSGPFFCHLEHPILSDAGAVLMEAGTRVQGSYKSSGAQGQNRLFAVSAMAYTPNDVIVPLDGPMGDGLGRTGFSGTVDNHLVSRFGGAVMLSLADSVLGVLQSGLSRGGNSYITFQNGNMNSLASEILKSTIDQPATITKNQGSEVALFVLEPISFNSVYKLVPKH